MYTVHFTLYTVYCTLHTVHCVSNCELLWSPLPSAVLCVDMNSFVKISPILTFVKYLTFVKLYIPFSYL